MNETDPLIRPVADRDMAAIQAIYAHHVLHGAASYELEPPDVAELTRRRDGLLAEGLPYLVAEYGERVLGYAYAGPYRPRPAYRFTVEDSIYLHADATGRGLGAPLLQAVIDACEAMGKRQMMAVIGDAGYRPSIRLHEKMGFVQAGLLKGIGFKFGRWYDCVLMQRPLGPGATAPAVEEAS